MKLYFFESDWSVLSLKESNNFNKQIGILSAIWSDAGFVSRKNGVLFKYCLTSFLIGVLGF